MDALQHPALSRVLYACDILANITTLLNMVAFVSKTRATLPPGVSVRDTHFGPRHWLFSSQTTILLVTLMTVAALWMLTCRTSKYFKHRTAICTTIRLLRLCTQAGTNLTPTAFAPFMYGQAKRMQDVPHLAMATLLLQPMAFYMQHSLLLLPWRRVVVIQLASTVLILQWAYQLPCFLQLLHTDPGPPMWQEQAQWSCNMLQSFTVVLLTAVGVPLSLFSGNTCVGMASAQTLQVFSAFLMLFVIPSAAAVGVQRWAELQHRQQGGAAGYSGNVSSRSADGSRASAARDRRLVVSDVCLFIPVLLLVLPVFWLVAEVLVNAFAVRTDCAMLLASAGM